jgi:hypothetical protein
MNVVGRIIFAFAPPLGRGLGGGVAPSQGNAVG